VSAPPPERDGDRDAVDAAWAEIVARWDAEAPPVGAWPAQEDTDPEPPARRRRTDGPEGVDGPGTTAGSGGGAADPADRPSDAPGDRRLQGWAQDQPVDRSRERVLPTGPRDAPVPAEGADGDADAEHYVPPEPPPMPRAGWRGWLPWAGVLGAPVLLLVLVLAGQRPSGMPLLLLVAGFVAGFLTLVVRLPTSRDGDDDDGAVV